MYFTNKMEQKPCFFVLFLFGTMHLSCCDNSFDLKIPNQQLDDKIVSSGKIDAQITESSSVDDKNSNKKRSFYERMDGRNSEYDFLKYGNKKNSNYGDYDSPKNPGRQEYEWENRRPKTLYDRKMDDTYDVIDDERIHQSFGDERRSYDRYLWGQNGNFHQSEMNNGLNGKDSKFSGNSNSVGGEMTANNENIRSPPKNFYRREHERQNDFNTDKELVRTMYPRYKIPSTLNYPTLGDFGMENHDLCKPEKAIIINLKTDCPLTKQHRNMLLHNYLFSSKPNLNPDQPPQILPNHYFTGEIDPSFYYA